MFARCSNSGREIFQLTLKSLTYEHHSQLQNIALLIIYYSLADTVIDPQRTKPDSLAIANSFSHTFDICTKSISVADRSEF